MKREPSPTAEEIWELVIEGLGRIATDGRIDELANRAGSSAKAVDGTKYGTPRRTPRSNTS